MEVLITISEAEWHALNVKSPNPEDMVKRAAQEAITKAYDSVYRNTAAALLDDPNVSTMPASRDEVVLMASIPEWLPT